MKVAICSSLKFKKEILEVTKKLAEAGYEPLFTDEGGEFISEPNDAEKHRLAVRHKDLIKDSDAVYFITKDGYLGTSGKIELGFAAALDKPIYLSEKTGDPAIDGWATKILAISELSTDCF
jgi:nucleoside 2-deoxyribosyltransferase